MRKIKHKLAFTREHVRILSQAELDRVGGGGGVLTGDNCSSVTAIGGGFTCNLQCVTSNIESCQL